MKQATFVASVLKQDVIAKALSDTRLVPPSRLLISNTSLFAIS
jgi:hypothetical protein